MDIPNEKFRSLAKSERPVASRRRLPLAFRVQKYLGGLQYPAQKARIIDHARQRGVEQDGALFRALLALPQRDFSSPVSLARELTETAPTTAPVSGMLVTK